MQMQEEPLRDLVEGQERHWFSKGPKQVLHYILQG
jgi:hypothetical protein